MEDTEQLRLVPCDEIQKMRLYLRKVRYFVWAPNGLWQLKMPEHFSAPSPGEFCSALHYHAFGAGEPLDFGRYVGVVQGHSPFAVVYKRELPMTFGVKVDIPDLEALLVADFRGFQKMEAEASKKKAHKEKESELSATNQPEDPQQFRLVPCRELQKMRHYLLRLRYLVWAPNGLWQLKKPEHFSSPPDGMFCGSLHATQFGDDEPFDSARYSGVVQGGKAFGVVYKRDLPMTFGDKVEIPDLEALLASGPTRDV